jgi:eukaryotic-like serine/threonine-protein kinase
VTERVLDGRYRLRSVLGRGGMATVWLCDDMRLGRPVAVKILDRVGPIDPSTLARFDREARTVARLAHPNIVTVHDVGVDGGVPYLVMELVDGTTVADMLAGGPLDVDQAVRITAQVCDALDAARAAGVVHRDVKPANIMITGVGHVKVCDFGIAYAPRDALTGLTGSATALGTSEFMAPEQVQGERLDHRTDVYALGCVLYAMLTGRPPFVGDNPMRVAWQQVHERPEPLRAIRSDVPADLDALVGQMLAKNPDERPPTAAQVRTRLGERADRSNPTRPSVGTLAFPGLSNPAGPATTAVQTPASPRGSGPGRPIRAQAAVMHPTSAMPILDLPDAQRPVAPGRYHLGPLGIAAVALAAAAIAVLAVIAFSGRQPASQAGNGTGPTAPAVTSPAATPSTPTNSAPTTPDQAISNLQSLIQAQQQAGTLDQDTAQHLSDDLDQIQTRISDGNGNKASSRISDLRDQLDQARQDDNLNQDGYQQLLQAVDQLAATLPSGDHHGG